MERKVRYSEEEWKAFRPLITYLYSGQKKTLKEVRARLQNEYHFAPTERMYKHRLQAWDLDKKNKKHEMLAIVRESLTNGEHQKFTIRGNVVTLRDAMHYFRRKGLSRPEQVFQLAAAIPPPVISTPISDIAGYRPNDFTSLYTIPQVLQQRDVGAAEHQLVQALIHQTRSHYQRILSIRNISLYNPSEPTTIVEGGAERLNEFCCLFRQGCYFLSIRRTKPAYRRFLRAFGMLERLLEDNCKGFLITIFDLVARLDGGGCKSPITSLMERLMQLTASEKARESNLSVHLVASWLKGPPSVSRPFVAFVTLHNLVSFFADRIGNFHPWTLEVFKLDESLSMESSIQDRCKLHLE